MKDWQVVEVVENVSKLKFAGSEEQAKSEFKTAAAQGTKGVVKLLNAEGHPVDAFEAAPANKTFSGLPIREIYAPLPAELQEAAARARSMPPILPCMQKRSVPVVEPETEPVFEPIPERAFVRRQRPTSWTERKELLIAAIVVAFAILGVVMTLTR